MKCEITKKNGKCYCKIESPKERECFIKNVKLIKEYLSVDNKGLEDLIDIKASTFTNYISPTYRCNPCVEFVEKLADLTGLDDINILFTDEFEQIIDFSQKPKRYTDFSPTFAETLSRSDDDCDIESEKKSIRLEDVLDSDYPKQTRTNTSLYRRYADIIEEFIESDRTIVRFVDDNCKNYKTLATRIKKTFKMFKFKNIKLHVWCKGTKIVLEKRLDIPEGEGYRE